jgi:hypothetical protein
MIIAVAATAPEIQAQVAMLGAHAPFYLLFDEQGKLHSVLANPFVQVEQGAERQVAECFAEHGIKRVIANGFKSSFFRSWRQKALALHRNLVEFLMLSVS